MDQLQKIDRKLKYINFYCLFLFQETCALPRSITRVRSRHDTGPHFNQLKQAVQSIQYTYMLYITKTDFLMKFMCFWFVNLWRVLFSQFGIVAKENLRNKRLWKLPCRPIFRMHHKFRHNYSYHTFFRPGVAFVFQMYFFYALQHFFSNLGNVMLFNINCFCLKNKTIFRTTFSPTCSLSLGPHLYLNFLEFTSKD